MQEMTRCQKKIGYLLHLLIAAALIGLSTGCSSLNCELNPKSDCLDVPCVPCIMPVPYSPAQVNNAKAIDSR